MPQTSIPDSEAVAYQGQISEPGAPQHARYAVAEAAVVAGTPVLRGTDAGKQILPVSASSVIDGQSFAGFVRAETSRPFDLAGQQFAAGDHLNVVRLGHMYLTASEAVVAGESVGVTLSSGALIGLGSEEAVPAGAARLPGCQWLESGSAGLRNASIDLEGSAGAGGGRFSLSADFAAAGSAGDDIAEQIIGVAPSGARLVGAYYIPAAAIAAGTSGGGTDMQLEINVRRKADPATQVSVALGSNVDADSHDWEDDGALAAWESGAFELSSTDANLSLSQGDVLTFELIAGASATYPAGMIVVELSLS